MEIYLLNALSKIGDVASKWYDFSGSNGFSGLTRNKPVKISGAFDYDDSSRTL